MRPVNPLLLETWRGLVGSGDAQQDYLGYLGVQALALLVWWPWGDEYRFIETQSEPRALLAVVIALGATLSLHGIRAGAEELLLPGQHPLREWTLGTPLAGLRIVGGYLAGHLLATSYLMLLSLPLVLAGYAVASAQAPALAWTLAAVVLMATVFRLAGALVYLLNGHRGSGTFTLLRVIVATSYLVPPFVLPAASHPVLAYALLIEADSTRLAVAGLPAHQVFMAVYGTAIGLLAVALHRLLSRQRNATGGPASNSRGAPPGGRT